MFQEQGGAGVAEVVEADAPYSCPVAEAVKAPVDDAAFERCADLAREQEVVVAPFVADSFTELLLPGSDIASWGGTACLIASASYAVGYIYMDRYLARRGIEPLALSASQLLAAAALLLLAVPFDGLQPPELSWDVLGAILVLGALGTGIAYVLNYWLITHEGTAASVVIYLLPIVAVALGALVLNEPITLQVVAGMAVVLLGVALSRRHPQPQTTSTAE